MAETTLKIKIDKDLKEQAEAAFDEMGMSISTAFNVFIRQTLRQGKIPFEITLSASNKDTMQAMKDVDDGVNLSKSFDSVEELMGDLNA